MDEHQEIKLNVNLLSLIKKTKPQIDTIIQDSFPKISPELKDFYRLLKLELESFPGEHLYLLPLLVGKIFNGTSRLLLHWASVFELLVETVGFLDNLPSLYLNNDINTNDKTGRGMDAMKLLASDALIPQVFQILSKIELWKQIPSEIALQTMEDLSSSLTDQGMLNGLLMQSNTGKFRTIDQVETVSSNKTGVLFGYILKISAQLAGAQKNNLKDTCQIGQLLGTSFPATRYFHIINGIQETSKYQTYINIFSDMDSSDLVQWLKTMKKNVFHIINQWDQPAAMLLAEFCHSFYQVDT